MARKKTVKLTYWDSGKRYKCPDCKKVLKVLEEFYLCEGCDLEVTFVIRMKG